MWYTHKSHSKEDQTPSRGITTHTPLDKKGLAADSLHVRVCVCLCLWVYVGVFVCVRITKKSLCVCVYVKHTNKSQNNYNLPKWGLLLTRRGLLLIVCAIARMADR